MRRLTEPSTGNGHREDVVPGVASVELPPLAGTLLNEVWTHPGSRPTVGSQIGLLPVPLPSPSRHRSGRPRPLHSCGCHAVHVVHRDLHAQIVQGRPRGLAGLDLEALALGGLAHREEQLADHPQDHAEEARVTSTSTRVNPRAAPLLEVFATARHKPPPW